VKRGERQKLLISVVLLLLTGFFATSIASYLVSARSLRAGILEQQLPLTGDSVYSEIQRDLLRPISISDQMAHDTFVIDWALDGERDPDAIIRYLTNIQERFGATTTFFVSERTRRYYHPTGIIQKMSETDPADSWFFRVRADTAKYEINVDADRANAETVTVFINYRLLDDDGAFLGVTGVGLTLATINATVDSYEKRFGRNISFVDSQGNIVLSGPGLADETRSLSEREGIRSIADEIVSGRSGTQRLSYRTSRGTTLVNTRFIPELKWHLIVEQDEKPSLSPVRKVLFANLALGTVAALLVFGAIATIMNRYQRRLETDASVDPLTGLLNRRTGEARLEAVAVQANEQTSFSALLVDLDHFKAVNDGYGHLTGDEVLHEVVRQLRAATRSSDSLIRWGGEEFLVVLPHCSLDHALQIGESILGLVASQHTRSPQDLPAITASIGVAEYEPNESRNDFLSRLDALMYQAKLGGRNQIRSDASPAVTNLVSS
jgi:diguanylate cyclase (GGDEF)-like protein